jgi:hypothetical protein
MGSPQSRGSDQDSSIDAMNKANEWSAEGQEWTGSEASVGDAFWSEDEDEEEEEEEEESKPVGDDSDDRSSDDLSLPHTNDDEEDDDDDSDDMYYVDFAKWPADDQHHRQPHVASEDSSRRPSSVCASNTTPESGCVSRKRPRASSGSDEDTATFLKRGDGLHSKVDGPKESAKKRRPPPKDAITSR